MGQWTIISPSQQNKIELDLRNTEGYIMFISKRIFFQFYHCISCISIIDEFLTHRQTSKPRPIKNDKMWDISKLKLGGSLSTNDSNWLEHNWIGPPTNNKVVAHLAVRWLPHVCTPIPSVYLTVSPRLYWREQVHFSPVLRIRFPDPGL